MHKFFYTLLVATFFSSCVLNNSRRIKGNGVESRENRTVPAFTKLEVSGSFDVAIDTGSEGLVLEGDKNLLSYIETAVEGNTLKVRVRSGYNIAPRKDIHIKVGAPYLEAVSLSGSGDIESLALIRVPKKFYINISGSGDVNMQIDAPEVEAHVSGSGDVHLLGCTRKAALSSSGSGNFYCYGLLSEETHIRMAGSGNADVYASKTLEVQVAGSGDISYKGRPAVQQSIAGSGSVRHAE